MERMQATNELQKCIKSWRDDFMEKSNRPPFIDKEVDERVKILQDLCQQGGDLDYLEKQRGFYCIPNVFWSEKLVQFFLEKGLDINSQDEYGETALHSAIKNCLNGDDISANTSDFKKKSRQFPKIIQFLIGLSNPNVTNIFGETAIMSLAKEEYRTNASTLAIADLLVKRGADLKVLNRNGESLIHQHSKIPCIACHFLDRFEDMNAKTSGWLFLDHSPDYHHSLTPLMVAAHEDSIECCKRLVKKGANVNAQDILGYTALHHSTNIFSVNKCAEVLIELGANPNIQSATGGDVYDLAISGGSSIMSSPIEFTHGAEPRRFLEILEMRAVFHITKNMDPYTALEQYEKTFVQYYNRFNLRPPIEFLHMYELLSGDLEDIDGVYTEALKTVSRLSKGKSKFWNVLNFRPLRGQYAGMTFLNLTFLSEEFKRVEDFTSLEKAHLHSLREISEYFGRVLAALLEKDKLDEAIGRITQFHLVARLVLACVNRLIEETKGNVMPRLCIFSYTSTCQVLALIHHRFKEVIPKATFRENKLLLKTLLELDIRDQVGDSIMHLFLSSIIHNIMGMSKDYYIDALRECEFVDVKAKNLMGFEPVQMINWSEDIRDVEVGEPLFSLLVKMADRGAHIDAKNPCFRGALTLRDVFQKKKPFLAYHYDSLKCACARVLVRSVVPFKNRVPQRIVDFILEHS